MQSSCCFIGHKSGSREIKDRLLQTIEGLILNQQVKRFYVGTEGGFDRLVYEVLDELNGQYPIEIVVVLAYLNRAPEQPYYDLKRTLFPDELSKTPLRFAIRRRNSFMMKQSKFVVCYLNHPYSNAYGNIVEAVKKKKTVINLGEFDIQRIIL